MPLSNVLERQLLLRYIGPDKQVTMSLHSSNPGQTGAGEISGSTRSGYERQLVIFVIPTNGNRAYNNNQIRFAFDSGSPISISHYCLRSDGTLFWSAAFDANQAFLFESNKSFRFNIDTLRIDLV